MQHRIARLVENARRAARFLVEEVKRGASVFMVSHLDADGISAGALMATCLSRLGCSYVLRIAKQLDERLIDEASRLDADLCLFLDFGGGYLDLLKELEPRRVHVLDHHQPVGSPPPNVLEVNPHPLGLDGVDEISASGLAYLTAKEVDPRNVDLSPIAVVGALGDIQDRNRSRELRSANKLIVRDAIMNAYLEKKRDLLFHGRETRPIHEAIAKTFDPFIPGLSGDQEACLAFLANIGLRLRKDDRWRTLSDLSLQEKRHLLSAIVGHFVSKGFSKESVQPLIGATYTLIRERKGSPLRDAREYASLLSACGRMDQAELGVLVCMGDRGEAFEKAQAVLEDYRRRLAHCLHELLSQPGRVQDTGPFYLVKAGVVVNDRMLGAVTTLLASSLPNPNKPVIAMTPTEGGRIKISARIVTPRLNLGAILRQASLSVSGMGGGHSVAAGAQIPEEGEEQFLIALASLTKGADEG